MALLRAEQLTRVYRSGDSPLQVLHGVNLAVEAGEMTAIIGASGSGKTTLLQLLGTLDRPTSGELFFREEAMLGKSPQELARFRNQEVGFIFQFHHLLPDFSAIENVMIPLLIAGKNRQQAQAPAKELLERVELGHRLGHRVGELSGGEQQRAALARALIMDPAILLADEPTGNLDSRAGHLVFDLLQGLCRDRRLCAVMVTHNLALAEKMDHCLNLREGVLYPDR